MEDLTKGSVSRHLLKTTSFMLVTMVFQTLYFLVDLYWVGNLGKEAVAAVGHASNLMCIVLAATQMLGVGTTTLVSHAAGRKEHDRARLVFNQSLILSILVGLLFFAIGMAFRVRYAAGLSADVATATQTAAYLRFMPADWKPQLQLWKQILMIGLPAGAEFALITVYLVVVYAISRPFGAA